METYLIGIILLLLLSIFNYNFKIILVIILLYLLFFPDKRDILYKTLNMDKMKKNTNDTNNNQHQTSILFEEGDLNIKSLKQYRNSSPSIYMSIKNAWKSFKKNVEMIINNPRLTHPDHYYTILKDQRLIILNQMSSLITNLEATNLKEITGTKDRTLPLDTHIRSLIRKMDLILGHLLEIVSENINKKWEMYPTTEINPVDNNSPEPYNQNILDPII
jgi:hypothetical protein